MGKITAVQPTHERRDGSYETNQIVLQNLRGSNGTSRGMFDVNSSLETISPARIRQSHHMITSPKVTDENTQRNFEPLKHTPEKERLVKFGKQLNDMALELQEWLEI